jgi:hypothetical protein
VKKLIALLFVFATLSLAVGCSDKPKSTGSTGGTGGGAAKDTSKTGS